MLKHISEFFKRTPSYVCDERYGSTCDHDWTMSAEGRSWDDCGVLQSDYTSYRCSKCHTSKTDRRV
jgi:hypothetical protein